MNAKTILEILEALVQAQLDRVFDELCDINEQKKPYTYHKVYGELELWDKRIKWIKKQMKEEEQIQHCRMSLG